MIAGSRVLAAAAVAGAVVVAGCGAEVQPGVDVQGRTVAVAPGPGDATSESQPPTSPSVASSSPTPVEPVSTPCTDNELRKWVFVDLREQHMWMCARHRVAEDTAITSGMAGVYTHTPTGSYHIEGLNRNSVLTLNTGATYPVKFWIPFDAPLFGFHDSPWQHFPYGSPKYKTRGSHGCVHVPLQAIRFLYEWANIGTPVDIRR